MVVVGDEVVEVRIVERVPEAAVSDPDVVALWRVVQRLTMAQFDALATGGLRWRITVSDWESIGRRVSSGQVGFDVESGRSTLFTVPVEVVADAPGRWPELVLVVDRRV